MVGKRTSERYTELLPGIRIKTLVYGETTLMARFLLNKGSALPRHSHVFEQTGYLVKGRLRLTIGKKTFDVEEGGSWCIDSNLEHSAAALEDSIALEVFSPAREDYLKYLSDQDVEA